MQDILSFCTPESVGVSSKAISDFIDDLNRRKLTMHSCIIMRHGKVCAEWYAEPFVQDELHRMYSTSKTFSSMALGILIGDGRVRLTDKICDYFPEYCPENMHEWIAETTVREALMMSCSHTKGTYGMADDNFVSNHFTKPCEHPSGTLFVYSTSASNCIASIVEKISGKPMMEFLKDRALREIAFSEKADCVQMPQGGAWGGSGVLCSTRDLARFALLVYNDGYANGKQLLPKDYVREAKSFQIDNNLSGHLDNLHGHGYGYQIWRIFENGYGFLGMGGQVALSFPDYDLIYCMTGDVQGALNSYMPFTDALYYNILKTLKKYDTTDVLPENPEAMVELNAKMKDFSIPLPNGKMRSAFADKIHGKVYKTEDNPMQIDSFYLTFGDNDGVFHYHTPRGDKEIPFGFGEYIISEFPETHYSGRRIHVPLERGYRSMSAAAWSEEHKMVVRTYIIDDFFGNATITFSFKNNYATVYMSKKAEGFLDEYQGEMTGRLDE